MTIALFIIVLVALIVVHEFGHLVAAKTFRMRVDEFGIGYPPKAKTMFRRGGTDYTLNWLPFGGFVKIHGEDGEAGAPTPDSFVAKPKWQQAIVLVAGIAMNLFFAWILLSTTLALGMPRVLSDAEALTTPDAQIVISRVLADSPADEAGLREGDVVLSIQSGDEAFTGKTAAAFTSFIASSDEAVGLSLTVLRGEETLLLTAHPEAGAIAADPSRVALGVGVASVTDEPVALWQAPFLGASYTWNATLAIGEGLIHFFAGVFTFSADLTQVSGPIGIAGAVGQASETGAIALLTLIAVISINLALINIIPVPALDGGRLLFVLIEAVTRRTIPQNVAGTVNAIGFGLLILLMVVITASDIFKLFS